MRLLAALLALLCMHAVGAVPKDMVQKSAADLAKLTSDVNAAASVDTAQLKPLTEAIHQFSDAVAKKAKTATPAAEAVQGDVAAANGASAGAAATGAAGQAVRTADGVEASEPSENSLLVETKLDGAQDPLAKSGGEGKNLAIMWNRDALPEEVDVVVHFHGFSSKQPNEALLVYEKNLANMLIADRPRPTVVILPRGTRRQGSSRAYHFPQLSRENGLGTKELITYSLAKLSRHLNRESTLKQARLIITCHSGGGKDAFSVITHLDPNEAHIFDATYWRPPVAWAKKRISIDSSAIQGKSPEEIDEYMRTEGGAMRLFFRPGTKTAALAQGMRASLPKKADPLHKWYNIVSTSTAHNSIPGRFGAELLKDQTCCQEGAL